FQRRTVRESRPHSRSLKLHSRGDKGSLAGEEERRSMGSTNRATRCPICRGEAELSALAKSMRVPGPEPRRRPHRVSPSPSTPSRGIPDAIKRDPRRQRLPPPVSGVQTPEAEVLSLS